MASNQQPFAAPGRPLFPQVDDVATQERLNRYAENWQFYLGAHQSFLKDTGEPLVIMNYTRRIVDIIVNFSFRKGFDISLLDDERTSTPEGAGTQEDERFFIKRFLDIEWRKNSKKTWLIEAGQMAGVSGDLFVFTAWDVNNPQYPEGYVRNIILPSHFCFPIYGGENGRDRQVMSSILVIWPTLKRINGTFQNVWMGEEWTKDTKKVFENGNQVGRTIANPLGEIPITHIRNYPVAGQSFGLSDINDIVSLNKELNEKATDVSEIIFYHGSPITYLIGATVGELERGANRVWSLPPDSSIGNLELSGDLGAAKSYMEEIKATMKELAGVPENAFGRNVQIGDVSGVALVVQYLPLVQIKDVKVGMMADGLEDIHRLMIKTKQLGDEKFEKKLEAIENPFQTEITFANPMPRDEKHELELARERLDLGLSTRRMELLKMGHGERDVDRILEEADKEAKKMQELDFDVAQSSAGPSPFQNSEGSAARGEAAAGV